MFHLVEGACECKLETPYNFRTIKICQTGSQIELASVDMRIRQAKPADILCYLALDMKGYPYLKLETREYLIQENLFLFSLAMNQREQMKLFIDTSDPSLSSHKPFLLQLPMYFTFQSLENAKWQPIKDPQGKPFFLKYEICMASVEVYRGVIGIDFGTSNTCLSFLPPNPRKMEPELLKISDEGQPKALEELPTLFQIQKAERTPGKSSLPKIKRLISDRIQVDRPDLLVRSIKRHLGTAEKQNVHAFSLDNERFEFATEELVAAYLNSLQQEFVRQNQSYFGNVGNTSPCNFGRAEKRALYRSYEKLMPPVLASNLNLSYDEASAAAIFYTMKSINQNGGTLQNYVARFGSDGIVHRNLLVYDFGGGTIDISLVQIHANNKELRFKILGNTSIMNFGGDNVTLALFKRMKARFCHVLLQGQEVENVYATRTRDNWYHSFQRLKECQGLLEKYLHHQKLLPEETNELEQCITQIFITNFADFPEDTFARSDAYSLFNSLWYDCDGAKKALCRLGKIDSSAFLNTLQFWCREQLGIEENNGYNDIRTRFCNVQISLEGDLYPFIYLPLRQSIRAMRLLCMKEGETPDFYEAIHEIRLTGNSSKISLVKDLIIEEMQSPIRDEHGNASRPIPDVAGILKDVDEDTKTCVSKGIALAMAINLGSSTFHVTIEEQNDYLPFEIGLKIPWEPWQTIFPRGTKLPASYPYRPCNIHGVQELEIFRRIGKWHKIPENYDLEWDEYNPPLHPMGKFLFMEENTVNVPVDPIDHIVFSYAQDRTLSAHKMDHVYRFDEYRMVPPEADPFSGKH